MERQEVPRVTVESSSESQDAIENLFDERRTFPPDPAFTAQANAKASLYEEADRDFEAFWARIARERVDWTKPFEQTLDWQLPFAKWFIGGTLNISENCVDRHVKQGLGHKVAYHWIGEPGDTRTITYADLLREVQKAANALKELGVKTGDRVAIYMPMIPELPVAMLACARLGAAHTVVFGGFSAEALAGRINDAEAKVLITADGGWRRGKATPLKPAADEAIASAPSIEHVLVARRLGDAVDTSMTAGRDVWWPDIVDRQPEACTPVPVDSEQLLYLLYTSGTTAKPKGIVHTTAGYLVGTSYTHEMIFDVKPDAVYWCAADSVADEGKAVQRGGGGYLGLKRPWPALLRGIYGDAERCKEEYWSRFPGMYFAGDGAKRDQDGYFWLLGRVDDVMNGAGHRISTIEVESALVDHKKVAEAAVVGKNDPVTGQAIFAFVILRAGVEPSDALGVELREHVAKVISPIARPKFLMFTPDLPKTRSGKIMRRLLRDIAEGRTLGDTTTLADSGVVESIREKSGAAEE